MKRLDKSIFKTREVFLSLANLLPYPFIIAEISNINLKNIFFNIHAVKEFGYIGEDIKSVDEWFEKAFPNEVYRSEVRKIWFLEEIITRENGNQFIKIKAKITSKSQIEKWYEVKAFRVDDLYVFACVDINKEMILQDELIKINLNNDRMLSVLGHDLRGPIANLTSVSSLALDSEISQSDFTAFIQLINVQSIQVLEMLETTLNWAKNNFNSIQQNNVAIDVKVLITAILEIHKNAYKSKNITINVDLDATHKINSDLEITTVIIRNIISNAIKFTPENGTISIKFHQNKLTITDNGIGMSSEMIDDILNRNYSSTRGTNNEIGIGMGLQLVMNLAKIINCKIQIVSEKSHGTAISLDFEV